MIVLFANNGMMAGTVIVIVLEILSLLTMGVVLLAFRAVHHKQLSLFSTLHNAPMLFPAYRIILWVYIILTVVIGGVTLGFYVFQIHLL